MLSLDGGGSRGLVEAEVVKKLEEILSSRELHGGREETVKLGDLFDFIIGKYRLRFSLQGDVL